MTPEITPTDATLGAVVRNVRLDALDDQAFSVIEAAWHTHAVLIFPGQHLTRGPPGAPPKSRIFHGFCAP